MTHITGRSDVYPDGKSLPELHFLNALSYYLKAELGGRPRGHVTLRDRDSMVKFVCLRIANSLVSHLAEPSWLACCESNAGHSLKTSFKNRDGLDGGKHASESDIDCT